MALPGATFASPRPDFSSSPEGSTLAYVTEALRSPDVTCHALLGGVRGASDGVTLVTFSGDDRQYLVDSTEIRSLLLMTQAVGTHVCYQTEPSDADVARIKNAFIDPR